MANEPRPGRARWRIALVVAGMLTVGVTAGYLLLKRFPNAFDRESTDAAEVEKLKAAKLPDVTPPVAGGWPQWRGPNRDGRAPAGAFRTDWAKRPPRELWSVPFKPGYSSCSVVDGRLYTAGYDADAKAEVVVCVDAASAVPLWESSSPADYAGLTGYGTGPRSTPTVHDGRVYFVGGTGQFLCLEAKPPKGQPPKEHWRHDLMKEFDGKLPQFGFASSPLVEGNLVVVQAGGKAGSVVAFDRVTGEKVWAAGSNPNGYSSPVAATFHGVRVVLAMTGNALLGVRAADGRVLFEHPWATQFDGNIATPVVVDDWVFISSGYSKGCALLRVEAAGDTLSAKPVYVRPGGKLMRNHHSTCVFKDGHLYGFDENTLRCIDLREGTEVWDARGINKGTVILADKYLIGQTQDGTLFLVEATPDTFRLLDKQDGVLKGSDCWATPTLLGGRLYLRDGTRIVCLDVSPES